MNKNTSIKFGENIVYYRKLCHIDQAELANGLNVAQPTLANWEKGRREPNLEMLITICEKLQVTSDALLGIEKDPELEQLSFLFGQLNDHGKAALLEQAEFFASSDKYTSTGDLKKSDKEIS